jgi:hypothetical protein
MNLLRILALAVMLGIIITGCEQTKSPVESEPDLVTKPDYSGYDKDGTESLGPPEGITIAAGSGIATGGIGMVDPSDPLIIDVPLSATIEQVLVYWSGSSDVSPFTGDDQIEIDGNPVDGVLIGGPTLFYNAYQATTYRADITDRGLISPGANSLAISGMDYPFTSSNENNGVGIIVIYSDGFSAEIDIRDGIDVAYFDFPGDRQVTVPQTFTFVAVPVDRTAKLAIFAGSVGENRPNQIKVTVDGTEQVFDNLLYDARGHCWDDPTINVNIPAGATSLTVEVISVESWDPRGASLTWLTAALSVPGVELALCRVTGGGRDDCEMAGGGVNDYTFGGQAGAPTAAQPQPYGEWTHTQKNGPAGSFTFHAGTASAPPGTEIDWIECMDPGWCVQARPAPAKQIDFAGVGSFRNMRGAPAEIADYVEVHDSLHWFEVNIDDLGEPGRAGLWPPPLPQCDPLGFGLNGGTDLADCECPDFYRIRIHQEADETSPVMYEVYGYINRGNFQIHPPID